MQNEKIAIIALIVIIAAALSVFFIATYGDDLFPEDPEQKGGIAYGDCVDINYIGRYASNNTIFDSSYSDPENKINGTPLKIFVSQDQTAQPPTGYSNYSAGIIDGLMTRLIGLNQGETKTLGPIPPKQAYGEEFGVGDTIQTEVFNQNLIHLNETINQTLEVVSRSSTNVLMKWINPPQGKFTLPNLIIFGSLDMTNPNPNYDDFVKMAPPFSIWKNATEIIETTNDSYLLKTTPTSTENLIDRIEQIPLDLTGDDSLMIFPDATTVTYNETHITFNSDPTEGKVYSYTEQSIYGMVTYEFTVISVTETMYNVSLTIVEFNQTQYYDINKTQSFSNTFSYPRLYDMDISFLQQALPQFTSDLQREGYSFSPLAGESLLFEVTVENLIKTSEKT